MYNTHICSQHKLFHYRLEYTSRAPESASMCQILFAGRPIPRLPSDPHSVKQPEISLCVRVSPVSSSALPPSERSKFKRLSHAPSRRSTEIYRGVGRCENIIPLAEGHLKSTYMISQIIHLHDFNKRTMQRYFPLPAD